MKRQNIFTKDLLRFTLRLFLTISIGLGVFTSCTKKDNDDSIEDNDDSMIDLQGDLELSDFVWKGLNYHYYWQSSVPNLADSKATNTSDYESFIAENPDPEDFFESLKFSEDRFSWIEPDYEVLENLLQGISASNGVEFSLSLLQSGDPRIIGFVKYILPNSDASSKNIKRGDLFNGVNGVELTTSNYRELLYGDNLNYTLNLTTIENGIPISTGVDVSLTKVVNFYKNPILIEKTFDIAGNKIGYLMYNQFVGSDENDEALNNVFGRLKAEGITDLVLDLRYNRGGAVSNCTYLASMITGQFKDEIFSQQVWNEKLMDYWNKNDPDRLINLFVDRISDSTPINSLNLNRMYVLTTSSSASASELLINGLDSHIEVIQIGETTVGKNVGSITLYDYVDNEGTKNPNHKYAMQPIVLKIANSVGFADYSDGLVPDVSQNEDILNMGILGDENEPYLETVIGRITGVAKRGLPKTIFSRDLLIKDPEMIREQNMHTDHKINWNR